MNFRLYTVAGVIVLFSTAPLAQPNNILKNIIKARQGYYQMVLHNARPLFAMANGKVAYESTKATRAANNLKILATLDNGSLWLSGSSKMDVPGQTRAKSTIWENYSAFVEKGVTFSMAVTQVSAVAGNGLDALRSKVGTLSGACKACHNDFRAKKF